MARRPSPSPSNGWSPRRAKAAFVAGDGFAGRARADVVAAPRRNVDHLGRADAVDDADAGFQTIDPTSPVANARQAETQVQRRELASCFINAR